MKSTKIVCNDKVETVIKFEEVILPRSDFPSGHNLDNFVDSGRFNKLDLFEDHKVQFTYPEMESENVRLKLFLKLTVSASSIYLDTRFRPNRHRLG